MLFSNPLFAVVTQSRPRGPEQNSPLRKRTPDLAGEMGTSSLVPQEDTDLALGAPPLLPPKLKRARACSYSPGSSLLDHPSRKKQMPHQ